ncbi:MAG: tRNA (adenosine(37)-N6)-threonylcarbamoyltransferase complex ATPase subunit type 1 TsaE [Candidatus Adlerbacteria bacterium]|nr:tRNA (adenosine(37)-N6)-threonylcarbamoyltransferase complex ATPase subunit type 1 TsaE [Candidatus Adlerbacteria bacterium]
MKVQKEELPNFVQEVLQRIPVVGERAAVIALRGNLGAGKTTFTQELACAVGVVEVVQSPTYVLMKSYPISFGRFKKLVHIDAYRLDAPEQFSALLPEQFLSDKEALVVIEWPERVEGQLPMPDIVLNFSADGASEEERYIEVA